MKSTDMTIKSWLQDTHWKAGDIVWGCAYQYNSSKSARKNHQPPIRGMLLAHHWPDRNSELMGKGCLEPRYFAPLKKGSDTEVAWSRVVDLSSRDIADTEKESCEIYNRRIHDAIAWHESRVGDLYKDLIPMMDCSRDDDGDLRVQPVWHADLAAGHDTILSALDTNLVPRDDCCGEEMTWDEFAKLVRLGGISDYDGFGDLCVDGAVAEKSILYISMEVLVIYDQYMIPFDRIPEIFSGHDIKVIWFNK